MPDCGAKSKRVADETIETRPDEDRVGSTLHGKAAALRYPCQRRPCRPRRGGSANCFRSRPLVKPIQRAKAQIACLRPRANGLAGHARLRGAVVKYLQRMISAFCLGSPDVCADMARRDRLSQERLRFAGEAGYFAASAAAGLKAAGAGNVEFTPSAGISSFAVQQMPLSTSRRRSSFHQFR